MRICSVVAFGLLILLGHADAVPLPPPAWELAGCGGSAPIVLECDAEATVELGATINGVNVAGARLGAASLDSFRGRILVGATDADFGDFAVAACTVDVVTVCEYPTPGAFSNQWFLYGDVSLTGTVQETIEPGTWRAYISFG